MHHEKQKVKLSTVFLAALILVQSSILGGLYYQNYTLNQQAQHVGEYIYNAKIVQLISELFQTISENTDYVAFL